MRLRAVRVEGKRGVEGKEEYLLSQRQAHIDESLEHTSAVRM
jgi:hypothetical protein